MKLQNIHAHILTSFKTNPTTQIATLIVLIGTYTVLSFFFIAKNNVQNLFDGWGDKVQLSVYLEDDLTDSNKLKIQETINSFEDFEKFEYINKQQAVELFKARMQGMASEFLFDNELGNPLPASYELSLKSSVDLEDQIGILKIAAAAIQSLPGVEEISYGQGWIENFSSIVTSFKSSTLFIFTLLLLGSALIVSNTIKSSIHQRKEEIEVAELVGATAVMIRMPYIIEGAFWGVLTSALSVVVSYGLFTWQRHLFSEDLALFNLSGEALFLSAYQILGIVFLGGFMGIVGSYLCVRKINTGWAAAQRVNGSSW